jgi:arsenite methyltransferase
MPVIPVDLTLLSESAGGPATTTGSPKPSAPTDRSRHRKWSAADVCASKPLSRQRIFGSDNDASDSAAICSWLGKCEEAVTSKPQRDQWAAWIAERRHGGDPDLLSQHMALLAPVRDRVIANAALAPGQTVLDVGCGDGLIGFAAAEAVGPTGTVVFSDVSVDLLDRCRELAAERGLLERCRFVQASASQLAGIDDDAVDAVTLRSVLIYEPDKAAAFTEFHRVLRPGGRLSLFEPINRYSNFLGSFDLGPIADLMARVRAVFEAIQPPDSNPMLNFDERDLVSLAETAGFDEIHLELTLDVRRSQPRPWAAVLNAAANPRVPTLAEAMDQALTAEEADRLSAHLQPLVEQGHDGKQRGAVSYLSALRPHDIKRRH